MADPFDASDRPDAEGEGRSVLPQEIQHRALAAAMKACSVTVEAHAIAKTARSVARGEHKPMITDQVSALGDAAAYADSTASAASKLLTGSLPAGYVFISYRRDDTSPEARVLYEALRYMLIEKRFQADWVAKLLRRDSDNKLSHALAQQFAQEAIFMDVNSIFAGSDVTRAITVALWFTSVFIALIGSKWAGDVNASGQRRIDVPEDYVHLEVATALRGQAVVIPVLVNGAKMPELPESIRSLASRNCIKWSIEDEAASVQELVAIVDRELTTRQRAITEREARRDLLYLQMPYTESLNLGWIIFPNGQRYHGEAQDFATYGEGTWRGPDGWGVMLHPDGRRYEGEWKNGFIQLGIVAFPDGDEYAGQFREFAYDGFGVYTFHSGEQWLGQYRFGRKEGFGSSMLPNGTKFDGQYRDDRRWCGCVTERGNLTEMWDGGIGYKVSLLR